MELSVSKTTPVTYHVSALAASAAASVGASSSPRPTDRRPRSACALHALKNALPVSTQEIAEMEEGSPGQGHTSSEPASATSEKHLAPGSSSANHDAARKRCRGLDIVNSNACTECRKKRAKVQVAKCRLRYEIPVRQSKENLRSEIEQQRQSDSVIEALEAGAAPQLAQKHEYDQNNVWEFSSHRQTQSTRNDFHPDFMQWTAELPRQNRADHGAANLVNQRDCRQCLGTPPARIVLLLGVPDFCLAQQRILREGFPHSRPRYCSQILVSALLVLGCGFSNKPNIWANVNDQSTLVDHFFKETLRLFYREINNHTLTTIQAFSCMFLRDASCGRGTES
ncbi:hypothetical protein JX265_013974 [Neoarthrinium moseri]|uniref:Uncharacterized protein n=1 Tax=Neoarthrinium moseri TaxID=1658444 RepID=A0A9P9W7P0_9PEZI|nr:hypothetical protein JX265_013974 [Neoarthrinium moseri]